MGEKITSKSNIKAFVPELDKYIYVWKLQVGEGCYFVQELTSMYDNAPKYTVSFLIIEEKVNENTWVNA